MDYDTQIEKQYHPENFESEKECPECGEVFDGESCDECGYIVPENDEEEDIDE